MYTEPRNVGARRWPGCSRPRTRTVVCRKKPRSLASACALARRAGVHAVESNTIFLYQRHQLPRQARARRNRNTPKRDAFRRDPTDFPPPDQLHEPHWCVYTRLFVCVSFEIDDTGVIGQGLLTARLRPPVRALRRGRGRTVRHRRRYAAALSICPIRLPRLRCQA